MHPQSFCGFDVIAIGLLKRLQYELSLPLSNAAVVIPARLRGWRTGLQDGFWQVVGQNGIRRAQHEGALNRILKSANVAGPVIIDEAGPRLRRKRFRSRLTLAACLNDEMISQRRNII